MSRSRYSGLLGFGWLGGCLGVFLCTVAWTTSVGAAPWVLTPDTTPAVSNADTVKLWTLVNQTDAATSFYVESAKATDVKVAAGGGIYTAGYRDIGTSTGDEILATLHQADGSQLWETVVPGGTDRNVPVRIALDGSGNVYLTAVYYGTGATAKVLVAKLDASGSVLCSDNATVGVPEGILASTTATYILATVPNGTAPTTRDIDVLSVDTANCTLTSIYSPTSAGDDRAVAMAFDDPASPTVLYVLGTTDITTTDNTGRVDRGDVRIFKYNLSTGADVAWGQALDTVNSNHRDQAVALDVAGGDPYVIFDRQGLDTQFNWTFNAQTHRIDQATGASLWMSTVSAPPTPLASYSGAYARAIRVKAADGVYVALQTAATSNKNVAMVKYDLNGQEVWRSAADYDVGDDDDAVAIEVDTPDEVYIAATQGDAVGSAGHDIAILHYETGGILFDTFVVNSANDDRAGAIALGLDGGTQTTVQVVGGGDSKIPAQSAHGGAFTIVKLGHALADLTTSVSSLPASAVSDGMMTIQSLVTNVLDSTVGKLLSVTSAFDVNFYFATTPTDPSPIPVSASPARQLTSLASGATDNSSVTLTIPSVATLTPGNYYLMAKVDVANAIVERDESNNSWVSASTVQIVDPPDLQPTALNGAPANAVAGSTLSLTYDVNNTRTQPPASAFTQSFVLVPAGGGVDIPLTGTSAISQSADLSALASHGTLTGVAASVTIPAQTVAGNYELDVIVDSTSVIAESNETNNRLTIRPAITVDPIPDLTVSLVGYDLGATIGTQMSVSDQVQSADAATSGTPFNVSYYLSSDTVIDPGTDTLLLNGGSSPRTIGTVVSPGTPNSATVLVDIPGSVSAGVYYLGAIVDSGNTIAESNETNNTIVSSTQISVGLAAGQSGAVPDLMMTSVSSPTSVARGTPFNVDTVLTNLLQLQVATPFSVGIYLSTDTTITTSDYLAAQIDYTSLTASSDAQTTPVTIPGSIATTATWNTGDPNFCGSAPTATSMVADPTNCGFWKLSGSGALSNEFFAGDGQVEFTVPASGNNVAVGLSNTHVETCSGFTVCHGLRGMDYALALSAASGAALVQVNVYEKCTNPTAPCSPFATSAVQGDVIRVARQGTTIRYYKNGGLIYTSSIASSGNLYADVSLDTGGSMDTVTLTDFPVSPGTYYLGAIADFTGAVAELNENNNTAVNSAAGSSAPAPVVLAVQGADRAATSSGGGALLWLLCPLFAIFGWRFGSARSN